MIQHERECVVAGAASAVAFHESQLRPHLKQ
jgi:hypothetical protein